MLHLISSILSIFLSLNDFLDHLDSNFILFFHFLLELLLYLINLVFKMFLSIFNIFFKVYLTLIKQLSDGLQEGKPFALQWFIASVSWEYQNIDFFILAESFTSDEAFSIQHCSLLILWNVCIGHDICIGLRDNRNQEIEK